MPASLVVGLLVAWRLRLRHPWLVSAVGLFLAMVFGVAIATVVAEALTTVVGYGAGLAGVIAAYSGIAVFCGPDTRA
ncbi:hypothetical protein [Paractinoplanes durhamensis]|uniref:Uncharacterized protein n=1 Tax=Paractinoplanes durhamensis TaxID=113563 RepID=A0ABQ3YQF0_9ACTN|nr:hypothetical protein [Actinoplanes durhamensis]GID99805.1 hypothetical protein Adu01nite_11560 [Actinoplanes durhamensis]